jgi:hypothetical protein
LFFFLKAREGLLACTGPFREQAEGASAAASMVEKPFLKMFFSPLLDPFFF